MLEYIARCVTVSAYNTSCAAVVHHVSMLSDASLVLRLKGRNAYVGGCNTTQLHVHNSTQRNTTHAECALSGHCARQVMCYSRHLHAASFLQCLPSMYNTTQLHNLYSSTTNPNVLLLRMASLQSFSCSLQVCTTLRNCASCTAIPAQPLLPVMMFWMCNQVDRFFAVIFPYFCVMCCLPGIHRHHAAAQYLLFAANG